MWFLTSAKPSRLGTPSTRAQAASRHALPTQNPRFAASTALARNTLGVGPVDISVVEDLVAHRTIEPQHRIGGILRPRACRAGECGELRRIAVDEAAGGPIFLSDHDFLHGLLDVNSADPGQPLD